MDKVAQFITAIAEISDQQLGPTHPLLTTIKFIFADDRPAPLSTSMPGMMQGIKAEDFDQVIATAINMPIKMRFTAKARSRGNKQLQGHVGAIPVGHITGMEKNITEDGINQLVATAVLYADEFPNEIQYLKEAFAESEKNGAPKPGISYEINYSSPLIENGVEWLKNLITKAATFVKDPAYGTRTALLALASTADDLSEEELKEELLGIISPEPKEGNKRMDEKDKKITELETALASAKTDADTAKSAMAIKQSEVDALTTERDELKTANEKLATENEKFKKEALLAERMRVYAEAGFTLEADAEKQAKKKDFLVSLSDEAFTNYIEDLKAAKSTTRVAAASRSNGLPRFDPPTEPVNIVSLKEQIRAAARE